jgi:hypothetical protein
MRAGVVNGEWWAGEVEVLGSRAEDGTEHEINATAERSMTGFCGGPLTNQDFFQAGLRRRLQRFWEIRYKRADNCFASRSIYRIDSG